MKKRYWTILLALLVAGCSQPSSTTVAPEGEVSAQVSVETDSPTATDADALSTSANEMLVTYHVPGML